MIKQVEFGGARKGFFSRNRFVTKDKDFAAAKKKFLTEYLNTDAYQTILETWTAEDGTKKLYGPLYLDIDGNAMTPEAYQAVKQDTVLVANFLITQCHVPEDQLRLYFSGSKGFHILVPAVTLGIKAHDLLNLEYKSFAKYADTFTLHQSVDRAIYDNKRLFRISGSVNSKTGLYKVPLRLSRLREMDHADTMRYASKPKRIKWAKAVFSQRAQDAYQDILKRQEPIKKVKSDKSIVFENGEILPCVQYLLDNGVMQGNRNNTCVALASSLMQNGYKPAEVSDIMVEWNEQNEPPMPELEVLTTVKSAHQLLNRNVWYGCTFFKDAGYCQEGCPLLE